MLPVANVTHYPRRPLINQPTRSQINTFDLCISPCAKNDTNNTQRDVTQHLSLQSLQPSESNET